MDGSQSASAPDASPNLTFATMGKGFHVTGVNWGRDLPEPAVVADIISTFDEMTHCLVRDWTDTLVQGFFQ